ncbi:unnamed protein product [Sordaria macrospora k-hell]|uniref:WGS project CABT00000000 data, contig 2.15 n=1 Tax=Sordaria macrospora (strain ATCC MYA-333 / DSM 997 / K(L3346) / K-hell) TaxID=771870 RepID=F7VZQ3_SORMK|nr:uncharacterized protein SMAC_08788 [Sordaria macrospora k-hell]CCC11002.1 unnamed protein product [Sordaria macrospora k-hell]
MPQDDMLEHSLKAQSLLLPSAASRRPLTDFFTRALSAFQSSSDAAQKFQVICTAPSHASTSAAAEALGKSYPQQPPAPISPTKRPHTLIVLDSSFNPPTLAHLRMATSAVEDIIKRKGKGEIDGVRLLLLLAVVNADKAPKPAAFDQRLAMMWAFARDVQRALREDEDERPDVLASGPGPKPQLNNQEAEQKQGLDIAVDISLTAKPFFHEKSRAMAESEFYKPPPPEQKEGGKEDTMEQVILAGYDTLIRIFNPKYYGPPPTSVTQVATQIRHVHDPSKKGTPMQQALDLFFSRAKLRVTMRTDDEWGGKAEQMAYLESLLSEEGLQKIGGSKGWKDRIEMVERLTEERDSTEGCQ